MNIDASQGSQPGFQTVWIYDYLRCLFTFPFCVWDNKTGCFLNFFVASNCPYLLSELLFDNSIIFYYF